MKNLHSKKISLAAKEVGINRRKFKKIIKKLEIYSGGKYTYVELIALAKEFKNA